MAAQDNAPSILEARGWSEIAAEHKVDLAPVLPKLERLEKWMEAASSSAKT